MERQRGEQRVEYLQTRTEQARTMQILTKRRLAAVLLALLPMLASGARASDAPAVKTPASLAPATRALLEGRADEADALLHRALLADPGNAPAHLLLCRVLLSEGMGKDAAAECGTALADGLSHDSDAQDWAGRALGQQAADAGRLSGMRLALTVHTAFETAVNLAPDNEPAVVDLGEYYTAAPAIVGGGTARALALASKQDPARAEHAAALDLASGYTPARKGLAAL